MTMLKLFIIIPFTFLLGDAIPGLGESIGGGVLQFGAFGVVCWLAYYLVTKRMPEIESRHAQEREEASVRREERDREQAAERRAEREHHQKALQSLLQDSAANRDAFLASQCQYAKHQHNQAEKP